MSCSLSIKNIFYKNGEKYLFKNVSFDLGHKEKIAIVGKNGVGKSTLIKIIAGLKEQTSGEIEIFHNKINTIDDYKNHRNKIAYLPQNVDDFFITTTVIEDIMFSLRVDGISKEVAYKNTIEILTKLDILHLENRSIFELSGGEKKIVALAAILIKNPSILLLDEPTNDLDEITEKKIIEILNSTEKSMIIISHQKNFIDSVVSKKYFLDNGTLELLH